VSNEWQWVVAAYVITWAVVIGYLVYVNGRWRRARAHEGLIP
jgi:hypothetical protein